MERRNDKKQYNMTLYCLYDMIQYDMVSYVTILYYMKHYLFMWYNDLSSWYTIQYHIISYCMVYLYGIIFFDTILYHITWYNSISYHIKQLWTSRGSISFDTGLYNNIFIYMYIETHQLYFIGHDIFMILMKIVICCIYKIVIC